MKFTLVFENNLEGIGANYDLLFVPCPVWMKGEEVVLNLNPENPQLQPKSVHRLIEREDLLDVEKCFVITHDVGHGSVECLDLIKKDLDELFIRYKVFDFNNI